MEIYVACDVCGHRYVLSDDKFGRKTKCKSCGIPFVVCRENFYDPDTSESDEEPAAEEDDSSSTSPFWEITKKAGHGLAAALTLGMLVWMGSLVFRSPKQVAADVIRGANQPPFPRAIQNPVPQAPQFLPGQSGQVPGAVPRPVRPFARRPR